MISPLLNDAIGKISFLLTAKSSWERCDEESDLINLWNSLEDPKLRILSENKQLVPASLHYLAKTFSESDDVKLFRVVSDAFYWVRYHVRKALGSEAELAILQSLRIMVYERMLQESMLSPVRDGFFQGGWIAFLNSLCTFDEESRYVWWLTELSAQESMEYCHAQFLTSICDAKSSHWPIHPDLLPWDDMNSTTTTQSPRVVSSLRRFTDWNRIDRVLDSRGRDCSDSARLREFLTSNQAAYTEGRERFLAMLEQGGE